MLRVSEKMGAFWVKVFGMHFIPSSVIRQMGYGDLQKGMHKQNLDSTNGKYRWEVTDKKSPELFNRASYLVPLLHPCIVAIMFKDS